MAAYALANNIPVAVWELSNEAYLFNGTFFASGNDYATKMKPYRDAIKAAECRGGAVFLRPRDRRAALG